MFCLKAIYFNIYNNNMIINNMLRNSNVVNRKWLINYL